VDVGVVSGKDLYFYHRLSKMDVPPHWAEEG
jgi:hypothetical protein